MSLVSSGPMPAVGSSSSSTSGSETSAIAISSARCWPCARNFADLIALGDQPDGFERRIGSGIEFGEAERGYARCCSGTVSACAATRTFSCTVRSGKMFVI